MIIITKKARKILIIIGIVLVLAESLTGLALFYYGYKYKKVEKEEAEEILEFIRTNNPTYYEKIESETPPYSEQFYSFYTKKGDRLFVAVGIILFLIAINSIIPLLFLITLQAQQSTDAPEPILEEEIKEEAEEAEREEEKTEIR